MLSPHQPRGSQLALVQVEDSLPVLPWAGRPARVCPVKPQGTDSSSPSVLWLWETGSQASHKCSTVLSWAPKDAECL